MSVFDPLRILVISNLYPPQVLGGYERSIADFARLLQHRGHVVQVLTSDTPQFAASHLSRYPDPPVDRGLQLAGEWDAVQGPRWLEPDTISAHDRHNQQTIAHYLQTFQPDICLMGNLTFLLPTPVLLAVAAGVPTIHYVMNAEPGYLPEHAPRSPLHCYVTCSDWVAQSLQANGYPAENAITVYPGADVEAFYQPDLPAYDHLRIAYASLIMPYKGADILVEALSVLATIDIEFTATIAGGVWNADYVKTLKSFIAAEELESRVTFPGALSRQALSQLYTAHNVLVFPSRFQEPFGISQIEAMAAGLTLVTSGTGGAREIVEPGQDGLLFESENPLDLVDQLVWLTAHPAEWQAIAQRGQHKAMTQFSQAAAAEQLEAVMRELVAAPRPGSSQVGI